MNKKLLLIMALAALTSLPTFANSYYGKLTARSTETAKGLVYASDSSTAPTDNSYYTNSSTSDPVKSSTTSADVTLYAFAKPTRGYVFSSWTASNTNTTTVGANTGSADKITVTASSTDSDSPTTGTVTAVWTAATSYTISYLAPESGDYTVDYSYLSVSNNKFVDASTSYSLSSSSSTEEVTSYAADVVTLSTTNDTFLGWYEVDGETETLLSTASTYTYSVTKDATIKAKFPSSCTLSCQTPELGTYTVTYPTHSTGDASVSLTPISDTQEVAVYSGDEVTLTATSDNFEGWYVDDSDTALSTATTYTYTVSADVTITAKFSASEANAASVTSNGEITYYSTLATAITYANGLTTNPTVTLLRNIYDLTAQQTISKSMTIDLNGYMVASTATSSYVKMFYINASGIDVTITDSSEGGDGQLLFSGSQNKSLYAIHLNNGTLNINGGKIYAQNKADISSNTSARTYGVLVTAGKTLNVSGGEIEADANRYAYGIYANGSASATTTVNVTGGTITANADYSTGNAYGITGYADVTFSNATINANSTTGSYAYGINLSASSGGYYGTLNMTSGTINVSTATTYAFGINIGRAMTYSGQDVTATYRGTATISGGSINVTGGTTTSYGINTYGPVDISGGTITVTNNKSTTAYGVRAVDGTTTISGDNTTISATATATAYGVCAAAETSSDRGVKAEGNVVISGGNISATTNSTTNAFGVYVQATSRHITSEASGYYPGYYTAAASATISGGNITATTATTTAYGVYVGLSRQLNGQEIAAIDRGELTITGGTITATTGGTTACGVLTYGPTKISGGTITANATLTTAYGVRVFDDTTTITGGTISATATQNAYGVMATAETSGSTGVKAEGVANISGGKISATTTSTTGAYGVYVTATSRTITSTDTGYYPGSYAAAGSATISGGTFSATAETTTAYSVYVAATSTSGTASATPTCAITGGKFAASASSAYANVNNAALTDDFTISGGYYTQNTNIAKYLLSDLYVYDLESTTDEYAEGYRYYISDYQESEYVAQITVSGTTTKYETLEKALDDADSGNTVVLINNYKLNAAVTVPSNVSLLIPYDSSYTLEDDEPESTETFSIGSAYKTLIMLSDASITVKDGGAICVGGVQYGTNGTDNGTSGAPGAVSGDYGCIDMSEGGTITLESGANLYAWGYIVGQSMDEGDNTTAGTIEAKSGSNVYEYLVISDWHGGGQAYALYDNRTKYKVFPFTQYYVPNIEVPLTIDYGATEKVSLFITSSVGNVQESISFFGSSSSLFTMSSGCSVTKRYDPTTDRMHIDIDGDLSVNSISISMGSIMTISSTDFVMPITNNLYIKANSGTLTVPNDIEILPHAVVEIGEKATATISSNVYLYDLDEWDTFVFNSSYYYRTYNYRPTKHLTRSTTDWRNKDLLEDAKLIVDGTLNVSGSLYTTSSGADICSNDAGIINFTTAPTASSAIYQVKGTGGTETDYDSSASLLTNTYTQYCTQIPVVAPLLHNVDGSYTDSKGSADGTTYNYVNGYWIAASNVTLTAYTPGDETGTSKSLTDWLTLQAEYPNAIAVYSGTDESVKKLTNVVTSSDGTGVCTNFVATDKQPIDIPFSFTATTASYSRSATSYSGDLQWGTICLPFAVEYDADSDITFYTLSSVSENIMTFTESTETLAANTPAIFSVASTDASTFEINITAEGATIPVTEEGTVESGNLTLHGVMTAVKTLTASTESTDYYIAQNKFWRPTTNDVTVNPFRAYFTSESTTGAKMFSIAIDDSGETTSVSSDLNSVDDEIEGVYDVSGIRRDNIQKGINIIRFKSGRVQKVLIK